MQSLKTHLDKDFNEIRKDFPILRTQNRNKPLIFLDSAASTQKPQQVIDAINHFYTHDYANIHRGIYELSERSSYLYEAARESVKNFINAESVSEIVFVRGTTEGINLIAQTYNQLNWQPGDEIIISALEHHSNIVPWLFLKKNFKVNLKIIPMLDDGKLDLDVYRSLFSERTKLVAITHISNVIGTINPVKEMTSIAHEHNVPVLLDGAQAAAHTKVDVQDIDCDFFVFSAHKLYGPSGIGVLYGKQTYLEKLAPYQGGGGMIETVSFDEVTFAKAPLKFEAGTPNIADTIGLRAAIDYVSSIGLEKIIAHEASLADYAEANLKSVPGLQLLGCSNPRIGVFSFVFDKIHPHDIGTVLDHAGIAVRAGHHCAMPLMQRLGVPATLRISVGIYNQESDIDALVEALHQAKRLLS